MHIPMIALTSPMIEEALLMFAALFGSMSISEKAMEMFVLIKPTTSPG